MKVFHVAWHLMRRKTTRLLFRGACQGIKKDKNIWVFWQCLKPNFMNLAFRFKCCFIDENQTEFLLQREVKWLQSNPFGRMI